LNYEEDFRRTLITSVNNSGDHDSTGVITGNTVGAYLGFSALLAKRIEKIELK